MTFNTIKIIWEVYSIPWKFKNGKTYQGQFFLLSDITRKQTYTDTTFSPFLTDFVSPFYFCECVKALFCFHHPWNCVIKPTGILTENWDFLEIFSVAICAFCRHPMFQKYAKIDKIKQKLSVKRRKIQDISAFFSASFCLGNRADFCVKRQWKSKDGPFLVTNDFDLYQ